MNDAARKRLYTLMQVANTTLKTLHPTWCDEDYRLVLQQCGATEINGRISASTMSIAQMEKAMAMFKQKGFKATLSSGKRYSKEKQPRIAKLNAMWCAMADAGVVQDRSESAMRAWCENKVPNLVQLSWADNAALNKATDMLKAYARSRGVKVW